MARELAGPRLRFNANPRPDNANNRSISTEARLIRQLEFNAEGMRKINRGIDIRMELCYMGDIRVILFGFELFMSYLILEQIHYYLLSVLISKYKL